jgi:rod shape-determining protein MreC
LGVALGRIQTGGQQRGRTDPFGTIVQRAFQGSTLFAARTWNGILEFTSGIANGRSLAAENARMKNELAALRLYDQTVRQLTSEIESLRSLAKLPSFSKQKSLAEVTGYFPNENRLTLNLGMADGIRAGMPAITPEGLLGLVKAVEARSCSVLLLTAPSLKIGALVIDRNPPSAGLLRGDGDGGYVLEFQDPKVPVKTGDTVTTAGFSEKIPRGIPVGRVLVTETDEDFGLLRARVLPSVSLGRVREVAVLK